MSNKNYLRGVRLEREVQKIFRENGFQAIRTAGSHSEWDVILVKQTGSVKKICFVAFVQCKTKIKNYNTIKKEVKTNGNTNRT